MATTTTTMADDQHSSSALPTGDASSARTIMPHLAEQAELASASSQPARCYGFLGLA